MYVLLREGNDRRYKKKTFGDDLELQEKVFGSRKVLSQEANWNKLSLELAKISNRIVANYFWMFWIVLKLWSYSNFPNFGSMNDLIHASFNASFLCNVAIQQKLSKSHSSISLPVRISDTSTKEEHVWVINFQDECTNLQHGIPRLSSLWCAGAISSICRRKYARIIVG